VKAAVARIQLHNKTARQPNQRNRVKPAIRKYFALPKFGFAVSIWLSRPVWGRFAIVTIRWPGCDGRCGVRRVHAGRTKTLQRTAKSCGPGAATLASIHAGPCWRGNG